MPKIKDKEIPREETEELKQPKESEEQETAVSVEDELRKIPGVGDKTLQKMRESGYDNLMSIAAALTADLVAASGLGDETAAKIINAARSKLKMGFEPASEVLKKRQSISKITTGSKSLNDLLGGGVETQAILEAYGAFGSGKCVAGDTPVIYFNDEMPHVEALGDVYEKYARLNGEQKYEGGFIVPLNGRILVPAVHNNTISKVRPTHLYKEGAKSVMHIETERGRVIDCTGAHKLLAATSEGLVWKPAAELAAGDFIASPRSMPFQQETHLSADDAYFLGLFVAEGTSNPLSITISEKAIMEWLAAYMKARFGFEPTIRSRKGNSGTKTYLILLRKPVLPMLGELAASKAGDKHVPADIMASDDKTKNSFLAGYLEGDGHLGRLYTEAATKSRRLATDLSYLLSHLGIEVTLRKKIVKGETYQRLFVVGRDRDKLAHLPYKFKKSSVVTRTEFHGLAPPLAAFIRDTYANSIGGGRGSKRKVIGKRSIEDASAFYRVFTDSRRLMQRLDERTVSQITELFVGGLKYLDALSSRAATLEENRREEFAQIFDALPFAFSDINAGKSKSALGNYRSRGLPKGKHVTKDVMSAIVAEIERRKKRLQHGIAMLSTAQNFAWDMIDVKEVRQYDGFVYDFVVPEGHNFVGGNLPTMMHNSQLAHQLAVNVQLPKERGGLEGKAIFLDSENTFRPERIVDMAKALELDPQKTLDNIFIARSYNSDHQILLAEKAEEILKKENVKLIIVDSLTASFRSDYTGRGMLANRQQKLNRHMHHLQRLADVYNVAIYVTNQVMANPAIMFGDPTSPIGGHIVGHQATYRVYLRRSKENKRIAKLIDSPWLPEGETIFMVDKDGVKDIED